MLLRSVRFFSLPCTGVKPPGLMASSGKHSPSAKAADRATISADRATISPPVTQKPY